MDNSAQNPTPDQPTTPVTAPSAPAAEAPAQPATPPPPAEQPTSPTPAPSAPTDATPSPAAATPTPPPTAATPSGHHAKKSPMKMVVLLSFLVIAALGIAVFVRSMKNAQNTTMKTAAAQPTNAPKVQPTTVTELSPTPGAGSDQDIQNSIDNVDTDLNGATQSLNDQPDTFQN